MDEDWDRLQVSPRGGARRRRPVDDSVPVAGLALWTATNRCHTALHVRATTTVHLVCGGLSTVVHRSAVDNGVGVDGVEKAGL